MTKIAHDAARRIRLEVGATRMMDIFDALDRIGFDDRYSAGFDSPHLFPATTRCRGDQWPDSQHLCNCIEFEDGSRLRLVLLRGSDTDKGAIIVASPDERLFAGG